jgi:hypothetical protein
VMNHDFWGHYCNPIDAKGRLIILLAESLEV